MRVGALIEYRLRLHGVPVSWLTRIEEWEPGERFVDAQLPGPYQLWHHTHEFEPDGAGGTLMRDTVRYALPLGPLGELARRLFVARDLEAIFDFRAERVAARSLDGERALHAGGAVVADRAVEGVLARLQVGRQRRLGAGDGSVFSSTPLPSISTACGMLWTGCRS